MASYFLNTSSTPEHIPPPVVHSEGTDGGSVGNAPEPVAVKVAARAGRKKGSANKQATYNIMQWNQKELTLLCSVECARAVILHEARPQKNKKELREALPLSHQQSLKRAENMIRTLKDSGGVNGLAACVIEEVRTGGGGERAVEFITGELNRLEPSEKSHETWRAQVSGVVNPMSGKKEKYAIIWNFDLLGDLVDTCVDIGDDGHRLMTDGFERKRERTGEAEAEAEGDCDFKIGAAKINLDPGRRIWAEMKNCELGWHANDRFDRMPTLFSFQPATFRKPLHIIAIHGATGASFKSPHQQIAETMFLQEICGQAAEQGEYVVLVGDFNTAEDNNKTERLWDEDLPLNCSDADASAGGDFDEVNYLQATKDRFLHFFYRGVKDSLPTNVYPFLAGGNAIPKHNDDIWLPKDERLLRMMKPAGKQGQKGSKQPGKVHSIPEYVLKQWEMTTRDYFDSLGTAGLNSASKHRLNDMLSKVWSDHRPISVALKPAVEGQNGRAAKVPGSGDGANEEAEAPERFPSDEEGGLGGVEGQPAQQDGEEEKEGEAKEERESEDKGGLALPTSSRN